MIMQALHYLVTTGPESTGKTTLATDLSRALGTPLVVEQSRGYLGHLYLSKPSGTYQQEDLLQIARLQVQAELQAEASGATHIVCDTDLLVILIWSEVKYGYCDPALLELFSYSVQRHPRSYLLCDPAIPWEPDPLRENPHDRAELFERYLDKLQTLELPYIWVAGDPQERLEQALDLAPSD
jgi:nicotinamide riboside kinase